MPSPKHFPRQHQALAHRRKDNSIVTTASSTVTGTGKIGVVNGRREDNLTATELISYPVVWCARGSVRGGGRWRWDFAEADMSRSLSLSFHSLSTPLDIYDGSNVAPSYNMTFLFGYLMLELVLFPSPFSKSVYSPTSMLKAQVETTTSMGISGRTNAREVQTGVQVRRAPKLLEAVNRNGLVFFLPARPLQANLLSGAINLAVHARHRGNCDLGFCVMETGCVAPFVLFGKMFIV